MIAVQDSLQPVQESQLSFLQSLLGKLVLIAHSYTSRSLRLCSKRSPGPMHPYLAGEPRYCSTGMTQPGTAAHISLALRHITRATTQRSYFASVLSVSFNSCKSRMIPECLGFDFSHLSDRLHISTQYCQDTGVSKSVLAAVSSSSVFC